MADLTTVVAGGVTAGAVGAAARMPAEGVIVCAVIGAISAAILDDPPDTVSIKWLATAWAKAVLYVAVGIVASYAPGILGIGSLGTAPQWVIALLASAMAPRVARMWGGK